VYLSRPYELLGLLPLLCDSGCAANNSYSAQTDISAFSLTYNTSAGTRRQQHRLPRCRDYFPPPNFTIVLRVSVEFLVTAAGPPLYKCHAEYCSMYASSEDKQSTGTITL
jgi:hypothetical protein